MLLLPMRDRACIARSHAFADVRGRPHGDKHLLSILGETDVTRDMPSLDGLAARSGKARHDDLGSPVRLEIIVAVCKADNRSGVSDVYPLGIRSRRIKRHTERAIEARG